MDKLLACALATREGVGRARPAVLQHTVGPSSGKYHPLTIPLATVAISCDWKAKFRVDLTVRAGHHNDGVCQGGAGTKSVNHAVTAR